MRINTPARVHILFASMSNIAVVIVRLRSKLYHILKWHMEHDHLVHGSWFRGHFYVRRSDLSAHGKHMIYFALGPTKQMHAWTAISEAPYLKALALWPQDSSWGGGGIFLDTKNIRLNISNAVKTEFSNQKLEQLFKFHRQYDHSEDFPIHESIMLKNGWVKHTEASRLSLEKINPGTQQKLIARLIPFQKTHAAGSETYSFEYVLKGGQPNPRIPEIIDADVRQADWDLEGRLLVVKQGFIQRYTPADLETGSPSFEIDCNAFRPPGADKTPVSDSKT